VTGTAKFELQPCLTGELIELRPLQPDDWEDLFRVASDPLIWEQHPARDRHQEHVFREFFQGALESRGSRYCGYDPATSEVEIGWTFLARSYWGGRYNGEMKRLMLDHAFKFVDRVIFVVGSENGRSQKALEKIGAVFAERRDRTDPRGMKGEVVVYEIRKPVMPASHTRR
jgi:RimJ/RimL family protein N-acetyltransferase